MVRVIQSSIIHNVTGEVIPPYEVDDYPTDWLDAILAYGRDLPIKQNELQKAKHGKRN
jgi:hypothetical protein